jgi:lipoprotein-anchoring transpeptidase ErfK/SrfK
MTTATKTSALLAASGLALLLSSCATSSGHRTALRQTTPPLQNHSAAEARHSYWSDQQPAEPLRVRIDLSDQTASFYRGGAKVGQSRVATGLAGHSTPTGSFSILEKKANKRSNLYGMIFNAQGGVVVSEADTRRHAVPSGCRFIGAPMPYWMRLTSGGVGMHVGAIPNPGSPASHGCIRMPEEMARTLFENAPVGTRVTIVP